jgi:hypothetical protein
MTPKEKALELLEKFTNLYEGINLGLAKKHWAKQSALIAIDEILNAWPHKYDLETEYFRDGEPISVIRNIKSNITYWQEVKQEIEKL